MHSEVDGFHDACLGRDSPTAIQQDVGLSTSTSTDNLDAMITSQDDFHDFHDPFIAFPEYSLYPTDPAAYSTYAGVPVNDVAAVQSHALDTSDYNTQSASSTFGPGTNPVNLFEGNNL